MTGDRVRRLREDLDMSRSAFGEKLGVSADVVNNWERNRVAISASQVKLISLVYKISEAWLTTGEGPMYLDIISVMEPSESAEMRDRIRTIRQDKGLTQAQFAQMLGVKRNTIAMYESGNRTPTNALLCSICRTFHVREEWLQQGVGEMYEEQSPLIFDPLAFGPAGTALMSAAARLYEMLGEDKTRDFLQGVSLTVPAASSDGE